MLVPAEGPLHSTPGTIPTFLQEQDSERGYTLTSALTPACDISTRLTSAEVLAIEPVPGQ